MSVIQCALISTPPEAPLGLFCWLDAYCFRCFSRYIRYSESHHLSLERHYDKLRYPPLIALREIRLRDFSALSQGFYKLFSSMETRAPSHNSCLRSKIKYDYIPWNIPGDQRLHFGLDHAPRRIYFLLPIGVCQFFRVPVHLLMMFSAIDRLGLSDGGYFCACAQLEFVRLDRQPYVCGSSRQFLRSRQSHILSVILLFMSP